MGMRWDARGTIALLVSALVGVTAGVVVGFTTGTSREPAPTDPDGPASSPTRVSPTDPLRHRRAAREPRLHRQEDPGRGLGRDAADALDNAVVANADGEVKYLETAKSCNTLYGAENAATAQVRRLPRPLRHHVEPCALRMSVDHPGDVGHAASSPA